MSEKTKESSATAKKSKPPPAKKTKKFLQTHSHVRSSNKSPCNPKERKEDKEISYSSNSEHLFAALASDFSITPLPRKKTYTH
jgi:hypothetical protein